MQMLCDDDDGVHIRTPRSRRDADASLAEVRYYLFTCILAVTP